MYGSIKITEFVCSVDLHMGKTEGAEERLEKHSGTMLTPPFSPERAKELPSWTPRDVTVQGKTWDQSSVDISVAGEGLLGREKEGISVAGEGSNIKEKGIDNHALRGCCINIGVTDLVRYRLKY